MASSDQNSQYHEPAIASEAWSVTIAEGMRKYMASKDFADVKVIYGNKEHNFHKLVLCSQSGFFAKSLINFKEGKESKVVLKHGDIGTLDAMFSFLNSGDYDYKEVYGKLSSTMDGKKVNWKKAGGARGSGEKFQTTNEEYQPEEGINYIKKAQDVHYLLFHVNVYCLADFYDIPLLKKLAALKFEPRTKTSSFCRQGFLDIVSRIYKSTPPSDRGLRDIVLARAVHETAQRSSTQITDRLSEVLVAAAKIPEFACDLILQSSRASRICIACEEMMPKDKVPEHPDGILMCRKCCEDNRQQAQNAAQAAATAATQGANMQADWIQTETCAACEAGRNRNNGWGDGGNGNW